MMNNPFFRSRYTPFFGETTTESPKVVSIPIHFVESKAKSETSRSVSALKIQKVFRGFLVRKSMKKIAAIRSEVDEIERRISRGETVELIRRDKKERMRVNEALMALLFKLDSVRGVDSGVRDCRKAVIKKAIALQEKIDAFVNFTDQTLRTAVEDKEGVVDRAVKVDGSDSLAEAVDQALEIKDSSVNVLDQTQGKAFDATDSTNVTIDCCVDCDNPVVEDLETDGKVLEVKNPANQLIETYCLDNDFVSNLSKSETEDGIEKFEKMEVSDVEINTDASSSDESKEIDETHNNTPAVSEHITESWVEGGEENVFPENVEDVMEVQNEETMEDDIKECLVAGRKDNKRNRELIEKIMEDNGKMMSLMKQLYEKNEMQTKMLNSLTQRVEQMENAFISDRLRRKKMRNTA